MSAAHHSHDEAHEVESGEPHITRRGYLIGFALSAILTAIPFWMVMSGGWSATALTIGIFAFAVVQIIVQTIFFLHLDTRSEGGWTLMAFVFTLVIVGITIGGSVWVMFHLNTNMMPMEMPSH